MLGTPKRWLEARVGGWPRAKVILLLAALLGLDGADKGAIGAMAGPLEKGLGINETQVGLILTLSIALGAVATLPFGRWVDRANRIRLLAWVVAFWGVAMLVSATATSYLYLLISRLALAGVTACVTPAAASLVGDFFPIEERARMYGYVLAGEFVGTGLGFFVAGELSIWTWRAGFVALALPAAFLIWALRRQEEPQRGGASWIRAPNEEGEPTNPKVAALSREKEVKVREKLLLDRPAREKSLGWAALYVVRIPTSLVLILASACGYFFLSGIRTFGVQFIHEWFGVSHGAATGLVLVMGLGALGGVLLSGWAADRLLARGHLRGRVIVGLVAYLGVWVLLFPGLWLHSIWIGMVLLTATAFSVGAVNPPLDAARLDIMHPGLWGRAEAVRTLLRKAAEALAPLLVGFAADHLFHSARATRLRDALLLLMVPLVIGWGIGLFALKTYPRDVATAAENTRRFPPGEASRATAPEPAD